MQVGRGFVELVEEDDVEAGEAMVREEIFVRKPERRSGHGDSATCWNYSLCVVFPGRVLILPNEPGTCL